MKTRKVTYKKVADLVNKIIAQIKEEDIKFNKIISINRGGMVAARLLATKLDVRFIYSIGIAFYNEDNKTNKEPRIYQELPKFSSDDVVLIVDDIVESSTSMTLAEKHTRIKGAKNVYTAALYVKEGHGIMPDFFGYLVGKEWVTFPWE